MGEEATGVDVEPRVSDPQSDHTATDLIRSMALSSAELWHDVLKRLAEVQESQVILAKAVAEIGATVKSLSAALPALQQGTAAALPARPVEPEVRTGLVPAADASIPDGPGALDTDEILLTGIDGEGDDLVGPLPADVVAAFFPSESEVLPWYKRRVSLRPRPRRRKGDVSTVDADWPPAPPRPEQVLPPPPPPHLLDRYAMAPAAPSASVVSTAPAEDPVPVAQDTSQAWTEPMTAPDPVDSELGTAPEQVVLDAFVGVPEQVPAPGAGPAAEQSPLTPRPLVYTPSNAETAMSFDLAEPLALDDCAGVEPVPVAVTEPVPVTPVPVPFELDPPQAFPVQGPADPALLTSQPAAVAAPAAPQAPSVSSETPEPVLVGALGGRPVAEAQMSVSMATEILGSAAAAAPPLPSPTYGEPAPLVVSEDLTIVSKHHRRRRQFRLR